MTDHVDWAARFLERTLRSQAEDGDGLEIPAEYPWVGLSLSMFAELRNRGFDVSRRDFDDPAKNLTDQPDMQRNGQILDTSERNVIGGRKQR